MSQKIAHLTADDFDTVVSGSEVPIVVDFWAEWCGPCKQMAPILDEIAEEHDTIAIAKLDVDKAPDIGIRYGVSSIPTLIVFKGGEAVDTFVGAKSKPALMDLLSPYF